MLKSCGYIAMFLAVATAASCRRSATQYLEIGEQHFKAGKYAEAALDYRKAIQENSKLGEAYYGLGLSEIERNNFQEAFPALNQAAQLLPNRLDVLVKLADVTLAAFQSTPQNGSLYTSLTRLTDQLIAQDPNSFDGLRMKGNLALLDRKPEQAIQAFRRANDIKPLDGYLVVGYTQALLQGGRAQEAEQLARQMIEHKKDFGPIYDLLYRHYVSAGRESAGEELLRARVRNNPADPNAVLQLAAHYNRTQNVIAMRAALEDLIKQYATHPNAFLTVGDFYVQLGDYDEASSKYEKGLQAQPDQAGTYQKRLAVVRAAQKRPAEALELLERALAKTPKDRDASVLKANLLLDRAASGDLDKAIAIYQTLLKERADDATLQERLGRAYLAKNDLGAARPPLLEAARIDAVAEAPKLLLATISIREGKPAEAMSFLDPLLRKSAPSIRGRYLGVIAQMESAQYDAARVELDKLVHDFPGSKDLRVQQGVLAILAKRYKDAETIFSRISSVGPDAQVAVGLAEAYVGQQQLERALKLLELEARKSPRQTVIRRVLAKTAVRAGQYDRGISELQKLLQAQPNSATLLNDLGEAYREKGDFPRAEQEFQKAIQLAPKTHASYFQLGFTLNQSGRLPEAVRVYRQALTLKPNDALTLNNLAYALAESGNPKDLGEALQLVQRALKINPNEPDLRDTLGWVWFKKGMADQAVPLFTGLCRETPSNPSYQYHLGLALLATRNPGGAKKALETALANNPSNTEAVQIREAIRLATSH